MARSKTVERKEAFLAAAKEVFQEMGFDRASMDAVALKAGSSKATLYRYFVSKEVLFTELISGIAQGIGDSNLEYFYKSVGMEVCPADLQEKAESIIASLDPTRDVETTLKELGRYALKNFLTPKKFEMTRMLVMAAANPEVGRMLYEQGPVRGMALMESYFESLIARGQLRAADTKVIVRHFRALLDAEVYEAGLFNALDPLDDTQIAEIADRSVDTFLRAYRC